MINGELIATNAGQFIDGVRSNCDSQKSGQNPRARRELVEDSMKVYPMNQYGALQTGKHMFYQFRNGQFEFTESAIFTHLWKKTDEGWKLTRVYSYDHKPEP